MFVLRHSLRAVGVALLLFSLAACDTEGAALLPGSGADVTTPRDTSGMPELPPSDTASVPDGTTSPDGDEICPDVAEVPAPPECQRWDCNQVAAPECWDCEMVVDEAREGTACQLDSGDAGICAAGECVVESCDDGDPCTVDERVDGECTTSDLCSADAHLTCVVDRDGARCVCVEGYVLGTDGECVDEGSATGESCDTAKPIQAVDQVIVGDTTALQNNHNSSCSYRSAADVVYTFSVEEEVRLTASMTGFDTVLSLRETCFGQTEFACDDDSGADDTALLSGIHLAPGTYFLFADGAGSAKGPFELTLSFQRSRCTEESCPPSMACRMNADWSDTECYCAEGTLPYEDGCVDDPCEPNPCTTEEGRGDCTPVLPDTFECTCSTPYYEENEAGECVLLDGLAGETCADAFPLDLADAPIMRPVQLPDLSGDYTGTCAGAGPEAVFELTAGNAGYLVVDATGDDTVLYIRSECDVAGSELPHGCNDDADPPGWPGSRIAVVLEAGTYYLFADSYDEPAHDAALAIEFRTNPCDEGAPCNDDEECNPNGDWTAPVCSCPAGTVRHEGACVDDPCDPDPCAATAFPRCVAELPDAYTCDCPQGWIAGQDACEPDPDAAEWTILIYLNADNNLEADGLLDVEEMEEVGSTDDVHIVVELDTYSDTAKRLYVRQGSSDVLAELGEINMGDADELRDFAVWGVETYPARHYALILWNHGNGWTKQALTADAQPSWKGFSNDDSHRNSEISVARGEYAGAVAAAVQAAGRRFDLLGFDACLMGMWEVAHATEPLAELFVASEETIPSTGWSYDAFLAPLVAEPSRTAVDLGIDIVETYHDEMDANSTLSLVDLGAMAVLDAAVGGLADAMMDSLPSRDVLRGMAGDFLWFSGEPFADLYQVGELIAAADGMDGDVVAAATSVMDAVDEAVLLHLSNGSWYVDSNGLSIFLTSRYDPLYELGPWSAATSWDDFLRVLAAERTD